MLKLVIQSIGVAIIVLFFAIPLLHFASSLLKDEGFNGIIDFIKREKSNRVSNPILCKKYILVWIYKNGEKLKSEVDREEYERIKVEMDNKAIQEVRLKHEDRFKTGSIATIKYIHKKDVIEFKYSPKSYLYTFFNRAKNVVFAKCSSLAWVRLLLLTIITEVTIGVLFLGVNSEYTRISISHIFSKQSEYTHLLAYMNTLENAEAFFILITFVMSVLMVLARINSIQESHISFKLKENIWFNIMTYIACVLLSIFPVACFTYYLYEKLCFIFL